MSETLFDKREQGIPSAILSDKEIADYINHNELITKDSFAQSCIEASSYDIRVGTKGIVGGSGKEIDLVKDYLELQPGSYAGVVSFEKFKLPKLIAGRLGAKRALSYEGIILLTGTIIDPGYEGHLIFGLYNASQRKVLFKYGTKICSVVFEKLAVEPDKAVTPDANLIKGDFPDAFVKQMFSMEVLPWMQISERVKQIETITSEIIDLKKRYEDVMKPIAELTEHVKDLTKNIESVSKTTDKLGQDIDKSDDLIRENATQIKTLVDMARTQEGRLHDLSVSFKSGNLWNKIIWAVLVSAVGIVIGYLLRK